MTIMDVFWMICAAVLGMALVVVICLAAFEIGWRIQAKALRRITQMLREAEK